MNSMAFGFIGKDGTVEDGLNRMAIHSNLMIFSTNQMPQDISRDVTLRLIGWCVNVQADWSVMRPYFYGAAFYRSTHDILSLGVCVTQLSCGFRCVSDHI
jgi:hypothetical protein